MKRRISIYNAVTVLLIICTIPLGEINQYLPYYNDEKAYRLFPFSKETMQYAWYYVFLIRAITWILVMMAVVRIASNQSSHFIYMACRIYLCYRVLDLVAFMLCKSSSQWYHFVYYSVLIYACYLYVQYIKNEKTINGR